MGVPDRYDLVVANARLHGRGNALHHIGIRGGRIAAIEPRPLRGDGELDAAGNLVAPSFVNAHLHLDKVYTLALAGEEPLQHYTAVRHQPRATCRADDWNHHVSRHPHPVATPPATV